ncbi:MAG: tRNA preQ1(34) S-adenosylmethionine ribosyltransferase-isomerase QueA [Clostridia bacterium]|nr:tRNA preQ1(34) S-adenosylmethionine ribosyltransferase-isomerase QueA [Clostridia bacterium]
MKVSDFDYYLPEELIAQEPVEPRDASRLLVLAKEAGPVEHRVFRDVVEYLRPDDTLVVNNTKVIPARLFAEKEGTGARIEVVLLTRLDKDRWEVLVKPGKRARPGTGLVFGEGLLTAQVVDTTEAGGRILEFSYQGAFEEVLDRLGQMPLPPYITKELADKNRYQTVYAKTEGSAAAPTAGLHFTPALLDIIREKGVNVVEVLLHVGLGTFRPVKVEDITQHQMHAEFYSISSETAEIINSTKGRVIAVGTTSVRAVESAAIGGGMVQAGSGWTDIFIYPGYEFKVIDGLITNFHLPKSTLLMLISALAGRERVLDAYRIAVEERYRFFSFGDAMVIL